LFFIANSINLLIKKLKEKNEKLILITIVTLNDNNLDSEQKNKLSSHAVEEIKGNHLLNNLFKSILEIFIMLFGVFVLPFMILFNIVKYLIDLINRKKN